MRTNFSLLFYLKKPKNYQTGLVPVYLRITVNGKRTEITTGRACDPSTWNTASGRLNGTKKEAKSFNVYLDTLQNQFYDAHSQLTESKSEVTAGTLKNKFLGKGEKVRMLMDIFRDHNKKINTLVGKEYAAGTAIRYQTSLKHTQDYLQWKYKISDIDIKKIDHDFITNYEFYLRSERNCANNSAFKYIKNFKKIVGICLSSGWLDKDPFINYKIKIKQVDRVFLSSEDLQMMANKSFSTERLNQVRDIFLFCCFTGLAYADVNKLKRNEIVTGPDGEMWIFTKRKKTDTSSRIPLLPSALSLLNKYTDHPVCSNLGKALPVSTNQKMNAYLKEIAGICGIDKPLTFHIARHTFATTVTLSNGVPIESVSKMLGHTNIKTTQHYAKILDLKVSQDMAAIRQKYAAI
jgi:site-specific recombinase XerD